MAKRVFRCCGGGLRLSFSRLSVEKTEDGVVGAHDSNSNREVTIFKFGWHCCRFYCLGTLSAEGEWSAVRTLPVATSLNCLISMQRIPSLSGRRRNLEPKLNMFARELLSLGLLIALSNVSASVDATIGPSSLWICLIVCTPYGWWSATEWNVWLRCYRIVAKNQSEMDRHMGWCAASCAEGLLELNWADRELSEEIEVKLDVPMPASRRGMCEPGHGFFHSLWLWTVPSLRCSCRISLQCAQARLALLEDLDDMARW